MHCGTVLVLIHLKQFKNDPSTTRVVSKWSVKQPAKWWQIAENKHKNSMLHTGHHLSQPVPNGGSTQAAYVNWHKLFLLVKSLYVPIMSH